MLVLRKEIKIGIAAGVAILGIAGVYGLMASISGGSKEQSAIVNTDTPTGDDKLKDAVGGLPPKDGEDAVKPTPAPAPLVKPVDPLALKADPFAESNRTDGNARSDALAALTSGKIGGEINTNGSSTKSTDAPLTYRAPTILKADPKSTGHDTLTPVDTVTPGEKSKSNKQVAVAGGTKYVVQPGDTFSTIAAKVYGSKKHFNVLVKANPDVNPARMKVGQEITVPPKDAVASVGGAMETSTAKLESPIDATHQYRIASGDTLSRIAGKLYGKSAMWQAIYEANKTLIGPDEARLKVGTVLNLPERPSR